MTAGFDVFSPTGKTVFTINDSLNQYLGRMVLPSIAQSGSITNDLFLTGTPYVHIKANYEYRLVWQVNTSFSGNVLNWSVVKTDIPSFWAPRGILYYGVR